jgi:hypothetical protein
LREIPGKGLDAQANQPLAAHWKKAARYWIIAVVLVSSIALAAVWMSSMRATFEAQTNANKEAIAQQQSEIAELEQQWRAATSQLNVEKEVAARDMDMAPSNGAEVLSVR